MPERTCPECGSTKVVEVVYGYPTDEASAAAASGGLILGGCMPEFDGPVPVWGCRACSHEWQPRGPLFEHEPSPPAPPGG